MIFLLILPIFPVLSAEKTFESSFENVREFTEPKTATFQSLIYEELDLENFVT